METTTTTFTQLLKQNDSETDNQNIIKLSVVAAPSTTTKDESGWEHYAWIMRLTYQGRSMDVPFKCGTAHAKNSRMGGAKVPVQPTVADILYSLVNDSAGFYNSVSFDEWAEEYGYDTDSRMAERIYSECGTQAKAFQQFLGATTFDTFMNAEMDY